MPTCLCCTQGKSFLIPSVERNKLDPPVPHLVRCIRFIYRSRIGSKGKSLNLYYLFLRKDLTLAELNYTVTEKEFLAVVYTINKVKNYIIEYEVFIHTDHSTIRFLMKKPITNGRITKWLLLLQEFNITIVYKPSKENQVADFLFRLDNKGENILIDEIFPDENLFSISTNSPWFANIANYLTTKIFPPHFSPKEKKRVFKMSAPDSWIREYLFYIGPEMIIYRCVREDEMLDILKACHNEPCRGHFIEQRKSYKFLHRDTIGLLSFKMSRSMSEYVIVAKGWVVQF